MDSKESEILTLTSYLDDVKAERDLLREQLKKSARPIFEFKLGLDQVWKDLVTITERSDGWHFGLWVLFATVFGTGSWAVIYSTCKFWEWMLMK